MLKQNVNQIAEDERDPYRIPTKHNILMALQWLVQGCQSGDSLVFHYSGHGSQQLDFHQDEMDGYDETLLPMDHEIAGTILDDDINAIIVRPLPHGAKLHAIVDACHSGTVLDLPFLCRMNRLVFVYAKLNLTLPIIGKQPRVLCLLRCTEKDTICGKTIADYQLLTKVQAVG